MGMWINRERLASAVIIHLLHRRNYHIYLLHRDYDSYIRYPWRCNYRIKINNNIELGTIHAKTHRCFGIHSSERFLHLRFNLYIKDKLIREYEATMSLSPSKSHFGYWEVENIDPDKDKINKEIPQWAVHQIMAWVEMMRSKYN